MRFFKKKDAMVFSHLLVYSTGMADKAGNKDEHVEIGSENEKEELLWI